MDTQMVHPSVDAHDQHDHKVASSHVEEEGDHHEKKSVFKRVKAKAKQLRDTITNHGHGQHEPHHDHVHNPDEEEDDEDEKMVEDPEVHGAPIYESAVVNSAIPRHQKNSGPVGDSTYTPQDDHKSRTDKADVELDDPIRGYDTRQTVAAFGEGDKEPINVPLSFSPDENLGNDPRRTFVPGSGESEPRVNLQRPMGLEEDPASPKGAHHPRTPPNYQTKVTDPTGSGAEEVGVNQILRSFDKMNIYDQSEPSKQISPQNISHGISTGAHDQFSPEPLTKMNIYDQSEPSKQNSQQNLSHGISTGAHDQFSPETLPKMNIHDQSEPSNQKSPQNLSHDISTGAHDKLSPKTLPKMNIYDQSEPSKQKSSQNLSHGISTGTHDQFSQETLPKMNIYDQSKPSKQKSSQNLSHDISTGAHDQFSPETFPNMNIYDQLEPSKQKSPQNLSTGAHDQFSPETLPREHLNNSGTTQNPEAIPDNLESIKPKSYPQDNPVEKSANTTTYTHKFSSPASAISNKAISADNVDTSNLSYGEKDNRTREHDQTMQENQQTINPESNPHENEAERSSYTDKITSAASAIADTAISTKNIVASKLGYGEKDNTTGHEVHRNENSTDSTSTAKSAASSTADYGEKIAATITEKPSSVDEKVAGAGGDVMSKMQGTGNNESGKEGKVGKDKGVSIKSYIVEKLRPGEEDRALSQVISSALQPHNELSSTSEAESKPKVTESEEVKRRLGSDEDTNPVSQSYVEMLKGTVDSWLGRGGPTPQGSQESLQGKQGKSECASGEAEDLSHDNNGDGTRGEN